MIKMKKTIYLLCGYLMLSVCSSCIYDDLSDCGNLHTLSYSITGNTTVPEIIREELTAPGSEPMVQELEKVLLPMFSDRANQLSLIFYETVGSLHSQTETNPSSNFHTLQVLLPPVIHEHIALAHNAETYPVEVLNIEQTDRIGFYHPDSDTIKVQMTGIFTGQTMLPAEVSTDTIRLTMQNTAAAIVLIPLSGKPLGKAAMYLRNTACGHLCADSLFLFDRTPVLLGQRTDAGELTAFYSAAFPSRDEDELTASATDEKGNWEADVYIQINDEITKNTLHIDRPLRAGIPQVLCFTVDDRGEIIPSQDVSVSVELDWNPGFDFDLEL